MMGSRSLWSARRGTGLDPRARVGAKRWRMMRYIEELHPRGFQLLAFDLRGHGSSDADNYPNMLKFSQDIRAAIDYLESGSIQALNLAEA